MEARIIAVCGLSLDTGLIRDVDLVQNIENDREILARWKGLQLGLAVDVEE